VVHQLYNLVQQNADRGYSHPMLWDKGQNLSEEPHMYTHTLTHAVR
jgi:hypothetical protein